SVPWRDVLWALRRMEARGTIRGGRFVGGFSGEQYAVPEAVDALRAARKEQRAGETISLSAADPLNLGGIGLPGTRAPAVPANPGPYVDGALEDATAVSACPEHQAWTEPPPKPRLSPPLGLTALGASHKIDRQSVG